MSIKKKFLISFLFTVFLANISSLVFNAIHASAEQPKEIPSMAIIVICILIFMIVCLFALMILVLSMFVDRRDIKRMERGNFEDDSKKQFLMERIGI